MSSIYHTNMLHTNEFGSWFYIAFRLVAFRFAPNYGTKYGKCHLYSYYSISTQSLRGGLGVGRNGWSGYKQTVVKWNQGVARRNIDTQ